MQASFGVYIRCLKLCLERCFEDGIQSQYWPSNPDRLVSVNSKKPEEFENGEWLCRST